MGRIIGDTAIVFILLGATLRFEPDGGLPGWDLLNGTGSTLTTYVYNNSPAGEGGSPEKAYAAAFVLLLIVLALNFAVDLITREEGRCGPDERGALRRGGRVSRAARGGGAAAAAGAADPGRGGADDRRPPPAGNGRVAARPRGAAAEAPAPCRRRRRWSGCGPRS